MNFLYDLLPEKLINAIGWTIINSIWQGLIIGLILFAVLSFIPDKRSRLRYNISVAALCLLFFAAIFNLAFEMFVNTGFSENILAAVKNNTVLAGDFTTDQSRDSSSIKVILIGIVNESGTYLKTNFPFVITLWLTGILFFVGRFFGGFTYVKKMKYLDSTFVPAKWQNKLNSFRYKLKLAKPVRLLESARVNVPVVIGFIKPVILIPIGMLTGFSTDEIEAILAHELAHVVRNDYLINILQSIAEIIFFYNPALWWISNTIRKEREKCCDDIAVSLCGDSLVFARALANLEEINTEKYHLALAIKGKQNLATRIKRLFNKQKGTTMIEKTFAAGIIAIMLLTATVFASTINSNGIFSETSKVTESSGTQPDLGIGSTKNNIKTDETSQHQYGIEDMYKSAQVSVKTDTSETDDKIIRTKKITPEEKKLIQKEESRVRIEEKKMREQEKLMRIEEKKMRKEEEKMKIEELKMRKEQEKMKIEEKKMRQKEEIWRKHETIFMDKITGLFVNKGIIKKGSDFSLKLDKNELYVDGTKQPDDLHLKVKEIYKKIWEKELEGNSSFEITR